MPTNFPLEPFTPEYCMPLNLLGVASSVSHDCGYDPFDTLAFARDTGFALVQPYMDARLQNNSAAIDRLAREAHEAGLRIVCHGPGLLNAAACDPALLCAVKRLCALQGNPAILLHHDGRMPGEEILAVIERINAAGIAVQIENFYCTGADPQREVESFCDILLAARVHGLAVTPVFDIPRLFIRRIAEKYDALDLSAQIIDALSPVEASLILHCIDCDSPDQDRASWKPMGQGIIPYKEIAGMLQERGIGVDALILEFEDKPMCMASREFVTGLFA